MKTHEDTAAERRRLLEQQAAKRAERKAAARAEMSRRPQATMPTPGSTGEQPRDPSSEAGFAQNHTSRGGATQPADQRRQLRDPYDTDGGRR